MTIRTHRRRNSFGRVSQDHVSLTQPGKPAREAWLSMPEHSAFISIDDDVVMPSHFHGILFLGDGRGTIYYAPTTGEQSHPRRAFGKPQLASLSTIIGTFKAAVTRAWRRSRTNTGRPTWQRGFLERVIRDDTELDRIRRDILENQAKWTLDEYADRE